MKKSTTFNVSKLLLIAFILMQPFLSMAQSIEVKGQIFDSYDQPLPGVSVLLKGTKVGTSTDMDGKFTISAPKDGTLVVSFLGMLTEEIPISSRKNITFSMQPDMYSLDEVIAVGYGTVRKQDVTGAVSSIASDDLLQNPIVSVDEGMQGRMAGVSVQQGSGAPGQKLKMRIRGGSSINYSNEPLYVIDGFIGADISTISPNDIATIGILKDASATAIYGSRGANGVVLISTHKPTTGKMKLSFEANGGVSYMVNEYELLSAADMATLMNIQDGMRNKSHSFTDEQIQGFRENGGTDWVDLITQTGYKQNYALSLNGGTEKLNYYISGNISETDGILKNSFFNRYSLRSNISSQINDWVSLKFNTFGVHSESQNNNLQGNGADNVFGQAVKYPSVWPSRDENGEYVPVTSLDSYNARYKPGSKSNPEQFNEQNQENYTDRIISNLDLSFKLGKNLTFNVNNSGSYTSGLIASRALLDPAKNTRSTLDAKQTYSKGTSFINSENLTYENTFGLHSIKAMAVYEFSKSEWRNLSSTVDELSTIGNEWYRLENGKPTMTSSAYNIQLMRSYMARLHYSYSDKYLLTASMRADGSSVFNEENRWGYFPSVALAWRVTEEDFMQNVDWLGSLKIRGGYGLTGNKAVGPYATQSQLVFNNPWIGWYTFNNVDPVGGVTPGELVDPNLKWETSTQMNFGFDFTMLDGRLSGTFDVYNKTTDDIIIAKSIPAYTGKSSFTSNFASIENQGVEFALDFVAIDNEDFTLSFNGNITSNKNEVLDLGLDEDVDHIFVADEQSLGIWGDTRGRKFIVKEGESLGSLYGLKSLGLWQQNEADEASQYGAVPGEPKYEDVDGDGAYGETDKQIIGQAQPKMYYGLGANVAYKGFDLSIQCIGSIGNDIYNFTRAEMDLYITNPDYLNRWSPDNPGSTQQIMPVENDHTAKYIVSQYVEDGSFFKVKNLTLGYTLPSEYCEFLHLTSIRAFVSANNLLTFTDYTGLDPEASSTKLDSDSQAGIDAYSFPLTRTVSGGVKLSF